MTVAASDFAFGDLDLDLVQACPQEHVADVVDLRAPHVVELEYPDVAAAAIDAACRELGHDVLAVERLPGSLGPPNVSHVPDLVADVVVMGARAAVDLEAVLVARRLVEGLARL